MTKYYVPDQGDHEIFHSVIDQTDIRGVCGAMVDNSLVDGESPIRTRRPSNFCPRCAKVLGIDLSKDDEDDQPDAEFDASAQG